MTEEIRKQYQNKGWQIFPLVGKTPRKNVSWTKQFNGDWFENDNIGVALGSKSQGLVDVDLDWEEAIITASKILGSKSTLVFGRQSKRYSHYLFRCDETKRVTFQLPESFLKMNVPDEHCLMVAEIRGNGCYTMFPGSVHPSGEKVIWENENQVKRVELEKLTQAVGQVAFCAVCLRFWPGEGARHDAALSFAGICKWAGLPENYVLELVTWICDQQDDKELKDRLKAVNDTYKHDGAVSKWKKFQKTFSFPSDAIPVFAAWLGLRDHLAAEILNEQFAIIRDKSKVRIGVRSIDPMFGREVWDLTSESGFLLLQRKSEDAFRWLASPLRREYLNGFIFDPTGREHPGFLNLWKGWSIEPKEGPFERFYNHIYEVLAAGNKEHADYIMNWFAFMIQKPHLPAEVALVFRGGKGVGKGVIGKAMRKLCGQHGLQVSSAKMLTGNFNNHLRDCVFLFADEAFWAGDKSAEGQLKRMITEDTLLIEGKGRDAVSAPNMLHIMMASNEQWVAPSSVDERRFSVHDASNKYQGNQEYFDKLFNSLDEELPGFLHWALSADLRGWYPRHNVPRTSALQEQIERSENAGWALLRESLEIGSLPGTREGYNQPNDLVVANYMKELSHKAYGRTITTKAVSQMVIQIFGVKPDRNGYYLDGVNVQGDPVVKRGTRYVLPTLKECRMLFDPNAEWDNSAEWAFHVKEAEF